MLSDLKALKEYRFRLTDTWYHGTFKDSYDNISEKGIDFSHGVRLQRKLDFGPGFYLTSSREQAERFILGKREVSIFNKKKTPCVIVYKIDMERLVAEYNGAFYHDFDKDFADFVVENRRAAGLRHSHDFVFGKVADGTNLVEKTDQYRQGDISHKKYLREIRNRRYENDDQLSLHNSGIRAIMNEIEVFELKKGGDWIGNQGKNG